MSTDYFIYSLLSRHSLARSTEVNERFQLIETGLGYLPSRVTFRLAVKPTVAAAGAANAITVENAEPISAYALGQRVSFRASAPNTGATTLNVDGVGAVALRRSDGTALLASDLTAGRVYEAVYDGTYWQLTSLTPAELVAVGAGALPLPLSLAVGGTGATTPAGARNSLELSDASTYPVATAAEFLEDVEDRVLSPNPVWEAAEFVTLADAATIAINLEAAINMTVTLAGNRELGAPSAAKPGQSGVIEIVQDATGSRLLTYDPVWKFASGTDPTLITDAGARDFLFYQVITPTFIVGSLLRDVK